MRDMNWTAIAGISGASAIALGAFGAHGLRNRITDERMLKAWDTAAHYHLIHSVALLACPKGGNANLVCGLWTAGIALFSGSIYAMVLSGERSLGMITPTGGVSFIAGWLALALRR